MLVATTHEPLLRLIRLLHHKRLDYCTNVLDRTTNVLDRTTNVHDRTTNVLNRTTD
jgi:hypothetical protein